MPIRSSIYACSAVLALSAFFAASALGQASSSSSASMEREIEELRAENAAVREQLKALVDEVNRLQRRLDGDPDTAIITPASKSAQTAASQTPVANAASNTPPAVAQLASTSGRPESVPGPPQTNDDRYRDGIVIWEASEEAKVPFMLKFNVNTQLRYLNTLDSNKTFTDHLGVTRDVHTRNDIGDCLRRPTS